MNKNKNKNITLELGMAVHSCPACKSAYIRHHGDKMYYEDPPSMMDSNQLPLRMKYIISSYECLEKCGLQFEFRYKWDAWRIKDKEWVKPTGGYKHR